MEPAGPFSAEADDRAEKHRRRLERASEARLLDPWERYRALCDLHDAQFDVTEFADRKARFALVVMGALNALNLIVVLQPRMVAQLGPWLAGYITVYAVLSLFFFVQAIQALRPRSSLFPSASRSSETRSRVRFIPDILGASADEYYERWTTSSIGQLNRELALHVQVLARLNQVKFRALDHVYKGLLALTFLTAAMVTVVAFKVLTTP